ncbi:MAG: lysophospholipid acyltransferase family protein [Holophagales bacterium]|nr:lysophospholipid acyltransferase family protein [Holophagales bacterium]MBK9965872.1 lysophospholipid acyltransferase family protein [Holophagales bacterium]
MSFAVWLIARTPLPLAAALSWILSWLWWTVVPVRRNLAVANFKAALPGLVPGPPLRQMLRGIILGYFELFRELHRPGTVTLAIDGLEQIVERSRKGRPTLILATHLGSYDLIGGLLVQRTGVPSTVVVKVPRAPSLAMLLEKVRTGYGLEILANKRGSMAEIYELVTRGQLIGFFLDQRLTRGIPVPFFGRPALTAPSLAVAAAKTGEDVFFLEYWREGVGKHGCRFHDPFTLTGNVEEDTAAFTRRIEEAIRQRPHSWLWLHDRWKGASGPAVPAPAPQEIESVQR